MCYRYSYQNENGLAMESSNKNIDTLSTKSELSAVTACSSGHTGFSLYTTTHSNHSQRKRKCKYWFSYYIQIILYKLTEGFINLEFVTVKYFKILINLKLDLITTVLSKLYNL